MPALYPGRQTWEARSRWPPAAITAWRCRRVLQASSGPGHLLLEWWVQQALTTLPPSEPGAIPLVGDGSEQPKRGTKTRRIQQGRTSAHHPWLCGIRLARLTATWAVYRLLRRLRPTRHPADQTAKAWCRALGGAFPPPAWATTVLVAGAAASGSHEHSKMGQQRALGETARRGGVVCALARTWPIVEKKALQALVTPVPRPYAQRVRGPCLPGTPGCTTCWVASTRRCLRHIGDVPVLRSKRGRTLDPQQTTILGTKLDAWPPSQVGWAHQRRWPMAQMQGALQTARGLGEPQGRTEAGRRERALGMAGLA